MLCFFVCSLTIRNTETLDFLTKYALHLMRNVSLISYTWFSSQGCSRTALQNSMVEELYNLLCAKRSLCEPIQGFVVGTRAQTKQLHCTHALH